MNQGPFVQVGNPVGFFASDSPSLDSFGRLRVSNPETLLSASQEYNSSPIVFSHYTAGGASAVYSQARGSTTLSTGGSSASSVAVRQSKNRTRYQEGKCSLVKITFVPISSGSHEGGSYTECGYFDDNNGVFFRTTATGFYVGRRSNVSGSVVEDLYHSSVWNIDSMDGYGKSDIRLDCTKSQIFVIDL